MGCLKLTYTEENNTTLKVVYRAVNTSVLKEQEKKHNYDFLEVGYRSDNTGGVGGLNSGDIGNINSAIGYLIGAASNQAANVIANRSVYGSALPRTILRTPIGNINVATKALARTGTVLGIAGKVAGTGGLLITGYQLYNGQITGTEAAIDAAFGVIGFMGPMGAGVSILYFGGKAAYEYSTGYSVFTKPGQ